MKLTRRTVLILLAITVVVAAGFFLAAGWHAFAGPFAKGGDEALRLSQKAYEETEEVNYDLVDAWLRYQLFSWKWWVNVGMAVFPWLGWGWLRRKESTHRLLYGGFSMIVLASYLDFMGVSYGLWRYHIEVVPSIPSYIPWDFSMYPVGAMLFVQYGRHVSPYLMALLFACVASLAIEPVFIWLQFYEPVHWSVFYSLPIHFIVYLIGHWFGTRTAFKLLNDPPWQPPG